MTSPAASGADAVGKIFAIKDAQGSAAARRFKVTAFDEKSKPHKNRPAFVVERLGTDSYHEPLAEEFLATHIEVSSPPLDG